MSWKLGLSLVVAFVVGAAFPFLALAAPVTISQPSPASVTYTPTGGTVAPSPLNAGPSSDWARIMQAPTGSGADFQRIMSKPVSGEGLNVADRVVTQVGGKPTAMEISRRIPMRAIGRAAAKALPWVATSIAVKELWDEVRARPSNDGQNIEIDPGSNMQVLTFYEATDHGKTYYSMSARGVLEQLVAPMIARLPPFQNGVQCAYNSLIVEPNSIYVYCVGPNGQNQAFDSASFGISQKTQAACPAVVDPGNSAYNIAFSPTGGADGKCPTGRYTTSTVAALGNLIEALPDLPDKAPEVARDAIGHGEDFTPDATPVNGTLGGPATVQGQPSTTTTTSPGAGGVPGPTSSTTTTPTANITYGDNTWNTTITTTTIVNQGDTTTTTTTEAPPEVQTCGLPGKPACKIDESGTPENVNGKPEDLDKEKTDDDNRRNTTLEGIEGPSFLQSLFPIPPAATCEPFTFGERVGGVTLDPCEVVNSIRSMMGFLWAVTIFWACLGMVRKSVGGAA